MPDGVLNMLKAPGMTSHDVVERVRRVLNMKRIGHTGTLDPAAAGVMLLMLGGITRLSEYFTGCNKTYRAEITLGIATDTLDGEGTIVARESASAVEAEDIERAVAGLTGVLHLPPPMHSAVRHEGRRLYQIARAGESVELKLRKSVVHRFELLDFEGGDTARVLTEVECSSGTFVRSLAALVGEAVGCPSYLSFLVRTAVGSQMLSDSLTGQDLTQAVREDRLDSVLIEPQDALPRWPRVELDPDSAIALCRGLQAPVALELAEGDHAIMMAGDRMLGIAEIVIDGEHRLMQPRRVLLSEDEL